MNLDPDESDNEDNTTTTPSKVGHHVHTRASAGTEAHPVAGQVPSAEDRVGEQTPVPPPAVRN